MSVFRTWIPEHGGKCWLYVARPARTAATPSTPPATQAPGGASAPPGMPRSANRAGQEPFPGASRGRPGLIRISLANKPRYSGDYPALPCPTYRSLERRPKYRMPRFKLSIDTMTRGMGLIYGTAKVLYRAAGAEFNGAGSPTYAAAAIRNNAESRRTRLPNEISGRVPFTPPRDSFAKVRWAVWQRPVALRMTPCQRWRFAIRGSHVYW